MENYEKSVILGLMTKDRKSIATIIDALGDKFFEDHAMIQKEYTLIDQDPKDLYRKLNGDDQYADNVESASFNELDGEFLQIKFVIKYGDKTHHVWGKLNRVFTVHKLDAKLYPDVISITERVVLKLHHPFSFDQFVRIG